MPDPLDQIKPPAEVPAAPSDALVAQEQKDLDTARKEAELERFKQTTKQRRFFSFLIYGLVVGWIALVFVVLFCQGFGWFTRALADGVLMWLVGGSTGSILGILYLVIAHLFPKDPSS